MSINTILHMKRINIIGIGLALIGLSIVLTPPGLNVSIVNFIYRENGIHPTVIGGLMSIGGWMILLFDLRLRLFILCTLPWVWYTLATFFFLWKQGLAITVGLAYLLIYALIFREAMERPL